MPESSSDHSTGRGLRLGDGPSGSDRVFGNGWSGYQRQELAIGGLASTTSGLGDGGVTYLVQDNLQLDLAGGLGLSEAADDWYIGLGVSHRFPR